MIDHILGEVNTVTMTCSTIRELAPNRSCSRRIASLGAERHDMTQGTFGSGGHR